MPMKKLGKGEYLTADDIDQHGPNWTVVSKPELVDGKFGEKYEIMVHPKGAADVEKKWSMNATTSDFLQTKLGENEKDWLNKEIEIEVVKARIAGESKQILYAKGAAD